jgi:alpha-1,2-mannosyltransferase
VSTRLPGVNTSVAADRAADRRLTGDGGVVLVAGIVVAVVSVLAYLIAVASHPWDDMLKGFDLRVYTDGGQLALHHSGDLYSWHWPGHAGIQYTYTPFAALLFAVGSVLPFHLLMAGMALVGLVSLGVTVWVAFRSLGLRSRSLIGAALLLGGVALWLEPVQRALFLGQVEPALMALIIWDLCQDDRRRWKGAATGLAAAIKLVPVVLIVYLLLIRKFRAAAVAAGTFAVTIGIGLVFLPHESTRFWVPSYFFNASRTGFVGTAANQSLRGLITRLAGSVNTGEHIWLPVAVVVTLAGLGAAAVLHRRGREFEGLMTAQVTLLLASPISWDHHWVWVAPFLAIGIAYAWRARTALSRSGWLAGTVAVAAIYGAWPKFWTNPVQVLQGGLIWYAPSSSFPSGDNPAYAEYHWHGMQLIAGNLYLLAGCAMFVVALGFALKELPKVGVPGHRGEVLGEPDPQG